MGVKERVQEISNNKNVKIGMGPVTAKIELTGRCNFDCLYCNHHDMANYFFLFQSHKHIFEK